METHGLEIHLYCTSCGCQFSAASNDPPDNVITRMIDEDLWYALADGQTFEEMIFNALVSRGRIGCPKCATSVCVHEGSIHELLSSGEFCVE